MPNRVNVSRLHTHMSLIAAAVLLIVLLTGCGNRDTEAVVERRDITAYLPLEGEVHSPPGERADLKSPYEAPVDEIYVTVGQKVKKGEVIIGLAAPRNEMYYQQARQRLQTAQNQLAQAEGQWNSSIKQAKQQVILARQAEQSARKAAQTPQTYEGSEEVSVTVVGGGQQELQDATQTRIDAEQNLEDLMAQRDQALASYQQQVATAEQEFADAQTGVKAAMIRAPISGTVLDINTSIGTNVTPDQKEPLASIVNLQALKVYSAVDKDHLSHVKPEMPAIVTINDVPNEKMEGKVSHLYSEKAGLLRGTKYVAVTDFNNEKGQAKPGMAALSSVRIGTAKDVLAVPASAVFERDDKNAVNVREGGEWRERVVETGLSDGKYTAIKSGLKEGDIVQVKP